MKSSYIIFTGLVLAMLVLSGCDDDSNQTAARGNPFRGGTESVSLSFEPNDPPSETFIDVPFFAIIRIRNTGEYAIPQNEFRVKLEGFNPASFGLTSGQTEKTANTNLEGTIYDVDRNLYQGTEDYIEFGPMQYNQQLSVVLPNTPIRATACYSYGTNVISNICIKPNVNRDQPGDICKVNENKVVYSSSAPVQVTSIAQTPSGSNAIAINFRIEHKGIGEVFAKGEFSCDSSRREITNKVNVVVDAPAGLDCPSLGGGNSGTITLRDRDPTLVRCTLNIPAGTSAYVQPIGINLEYNYKQTIQRTIDIKP